MIYTVCFSFFILVSQFFRCTLLYSPLLLVSRTANSSRFSANNRIVIVGRNVATLYVDQVRRSAIYRVANNYAIKISPYRVSRRENIVDSTRRRGYLRGWFYIILVIFIRRYVSLKITFWAVSCDCETANLTGHHSAGFQRDKITWDVRGIPRPLASTARRIRRENPIFLEPFRGPCLDKECHLCFPFPFSSSTKLFSLSSNFHVNSSSISS